MATERAETLAARLTIDTAQFSRGLKSSRGEVQRFGRTTGKVTSRMRQAWSRLGIGDLRNKLSGLTGALTGLAGVAGFGMAIKKTMEFEDALTDLAIRGQKSIEWTARQRQEMLRVSSATGVSKDELAKYSIKYTELTGNADSAMSTMKEMAKVALSTGADMQSLATIVDQLGGSLNVTKDNAYKAFNVLRAQELAGAVGFSDIANLLPALASTAGTTFGARGIRGVQNVGAMLQLTRRATGSSAEAGVATGRFMENVSAKRGKIEKIIGQSLVTDKGEWKDLEEIARVIGQAVNTLGMDKRAKLMTTLGIRGAKAARAFGGAYKTGWNVSEGDRAAASTLFQAGGGKDLIAEGATKRLESTGGRYRKVMAELDAEMHRSFLPVLEKLVELMPDVASGAKWLLDNMELLGKLWLTWKATGVLRAILGATQALAGAGGAARGAGARGGMSGGGMQAGGMIGPVTGAITTAMALGATYISHVMKEDFERRQKEYERRRKRDEDLMDDIEKAKREEIKHGDLGVMKQWYMTGAAGESPEVAMARDKMKKLMPGYKPGMDYMIQPTERFSAEGGREGYAAYIGKLEQTRARMVSAGVQKAREKGLDVSAKDIAQAIPEIKAMDEVIRAHKESLAKIVSGIEVKPHIVVNVTDQTPTDRIDKRTGINKKVKAGQTGIAIEETAGSVMSGPGRIAGGSW